MVELAGYGRLDGNARLGFGRVPDMVPTKNKSLAQLEVQFVRSSERRISFTRWG